ncbi:hypothetical protein [Peptoniphilus catoniae]|uniref:hypothetical protein n=1 Tax=Peptoniphilus catoniae TaxID=1660341 RepID=UPI0010FEC84D|nr:hypothetical protein [Peptoniphilus catoniae]
MKNNKNYVDYVDDFLNSDEFKKLKNIVSETASMSLDKLNSYIERKNEKRYASLIPAMNPTLVDPIPAEEKTSKISNFLFTVIFWVHTILGALTLMGALIAKEKTALRVVLFYFLPLGLLLFYGRYKTNLSKIRMKRYKKYLRAFGKSSLAKVSDLALAAQVKEETVVNDINNFIEKEYFKEARLIENNKILLLDDNTYKDYVKYSLREGEDDKSFSDASSVIKLINYKKLLAEPVKSIVDELVLITEKFYSNIDEAKNKDYYDKFKNYYLPETIKLLDEYYKLETSKVKLDNEDEVKKEIESALNDLVEAYKKMLESTFEMNYMDIRADISVLKSMLKNEGLLEDDFN